MSQGFWKVVVVVIALTVGLVALWYKYDPFYSSGGRQRYNMVCASY